MSLATQTLHLALIRLAKGVVEALRGAITVWENWLEAQGVKTERKPRT